MNKTDRQNPTAKRLRKERWVSTIPGTNIVCFANSPFVAVALARLCLRATGGAA